MVAPEAAFTLGYQVNSHIQFRLGYTFLYLQDIARAADQVDFALNPNLFPPAAAGGLIRPQFSFNKAEIWIQSVNLGVEFKY